MNSLRNETTEAILGMSPGNSHFSEPVIETLIGTAARDFSHVSVMIPDIPAIDTYCALGYAFGQAKEKAVVKGGNLLRNRTGRVLSHMADAEKKVRILDWKTDIASHPAYAASRARMEKLYTCSQAFRRAVNETTQHVLEKFNRDIPDMEKATEKAARYLLAELSFLDAAHDILNIQRIDFVYHRPWPIYERLIKGEFDGVKRPHMGFTLIGA